MATYTMNKVFISSKRILVRYAEDGGYDKDGIIEIRPNIPDISIKGRKYAQIAIAIDSRWYIRGMAVYSSDIPDGYDVVYYTKKLKGTPLKRRRAFPYGMDSQVFKYVSRCMPFSFMDDPVLILVDAEQEWDKWKKDLSVPFFETLKKEIPPAWSSNVSDACLNLHIALSKMRTSLYTVAHPEEYDLLSDIYKKLKAYSDHMKGD